MPPCYWSKLLPPLQVVCWQLAVINLPATIILLPFYPRSVLTLLLSQTVFFYMINKTISTSRSAQTSGESYASARLVTSWMLTFCKISLPTKTTLKCNMCWKMWKKQSYTVTCLYSKMNHYFVDHCKQQSFLNLMCCSKLQIIYP